MSSTRRGVEAALGEHAHARVEQLAHRLAALRAQLALLAGVPAVVPPRRGAVPTVDLLRRLSLRPLAPGPCTSRTCSLRLSSCDDARPPGGSAILPPTSPSDGWPLTYADIDRISDEVAVGLAAARRRRGRRRRARAAARTRVPARVPRGREARRDHRGRERPALTAERDAVLETRRRASSSPRPASPRRTRTSRSSTPRRPWPTCSATLRVAGEAPPPLADDPDRPGRDHLHVGHDRAAEGRAVRATASSRSSPRPTSATPGTAAAARSAARRSRTSAS